MGAKCQTHQWVLKPKTNTRDSERFAQLVLKAWKQACIRNYVEVEKRSPEERKSRWDESDGAAVVVRPGRRAQWGSGRVGLEGVSWLMAPAVPEERNTSRQLVTCSPRHECDRGTWHCVSLQRATSARVQGAVHHSYENKRQGYRGWDLSSERNSRGSRLCQQKPARGKLIGFQAEGAICHLSV